MRKTTLVTLTAVGVVSMFSISAKAQTVAGALQLGLGTSFVNYSSSNITEHRPLAGGATEDYKISPATTTWGFADRNGATLEAGYGLNDMFVLGGLLQLGGWSQSIQTPAPAPAGATITNKESFFTLFIGPKLDVMFLPDSRVRPFVTGAIGLVRMTDTRQTTTAANVTTTSYDEGSTGGGLLLRAGIRCFLTPGFSLDPAFVFGYAGAFSGSTTIPNPVGPGTVNYDTSASGYNLGLSVVASGWVGL